MPRTESPTMLQYAAVSLAVLAIALSGCGPTPSPTPTATPPPPAVALVVNPDITEVLAGQEVALTVETSGQNLRFKWSATKGKLSTSDEPAVLYIAPGSAGVDTITVEVSSSSGTTIKSVSFNVIIPDTPIPTTNPTNTSTPTATPRNTPTPTPTPTATPTNTPTPTLTPTATPTNTPTPFFQNFEKNNGTPLQGSVEIESDYFWNVWFMDCSFSQDVKYEGQRAMCCRAFARENGSGDDTGGTVGIKPASSEPIDLSSAITFHIWVYDAQGSNTVELKLCDDNGCPTKVWSEMRSAQGMWTRITWPIFAFAGVDRSRIRYIEIYEWNDGTYCFDAVGWQ